MSSGSSLDYSTDLAATDMSNYNVRLISGKANEKLAGDIAKLLNISLEDLTLNQFADGEINLHIHHNVRGADVYVIQPTSPDVNKNLMELLLLIHTLRLSSAKRVTAIVPYYGYARQDRKTKPRVPISAAAVAQLIESMGPHRIVTVDLHCGQIQGFFHQTPVDNLFAETVFIDEVVSRNWNPQNLAIISPDAGGVTRARRFADKLGAANVVTILKRRVAANQIDSMQLVGEVNGFICLIVDDIIDTAGTLAKAAELLKSNGAAQVFACATHGIFSGPALSRIAESVMSEVWVTDSIHQGSNAEDCPKLRIMSLAPLLSSAIARLHSEKSLSALFEN